MVQNESVQVFIKESFSGKYTLNGKIGVLLSSSIQLNLAVCEKILFTQNRKKKNSLK